jgi:hypothetical protein
MASIIDNPDQVPGAASSGYGRQNEQIYAMRTGHIMLGLTGMADTTRPKIADGSVFEVNGAFYKCAADEDIAPSPTPSPNKKNYIYAVPDGDSASFTFMANAPEPSWNAKKGGWYNGNNRAVARIFYQIEAGVGKYYDKIVLDSYAAGASSSSNAPIPNPSPGQTPDVTFNTVGNFTTLLLPGGYHVVMKGPSGGDGGDGGDGGSSGAAGYSGQVGMDGQNLVVKFEVAEQFSLGVEIYPRGERGVDGGNGGSGAVGSPGGGGGGGSGGGGGGPVRLYGQVNYVCNGGLGGVGGGGGKGGPNNTGGNGGSGGQAGYPPPLLNFRPEGTPGGNGSAGSGAGGGSGGLGGAPGGKYAAAGDTNGRVDIYKMW